MKKILTLLLMVLIGISLTACNTEDTTAETTDAPLTCGVNQTKINGVCTDNEEDEPLSVSEVLLEDDLTFVTVLGVVAGFDLGKRHIVIEDFDGTSAIQIFKSSGYPFVQVGDEVLVTGYRTFDRSTDRLDPETLEIISSDNPTTKDNPTVINSEDLNDWTNENRTNADILFRWYTFEDVTILSKSDTYTYIDNAYDDEPDGRGLKIAVKDTSFYSADNLLEGMTYTFTALVFGSSDDFFDENLDGTVLRLSILSADDITLEIEEGSANISFSERDFYYVGETEPTWIDYLTVVDSEDGEITLTPEMITENVDMAVAGDYEVTVTYENSLSQSLMATVDITITDQASTVTEAIDAEVGSEMLVEGIVIGYGLDGDTKKPIIIEDPANGNAIEIWGNSDYSAIEVGDKIVVYTGATTLSKDQPRLDSHELVSIVDSGNALYAPEVIVDLDAFLVNLETSGEVIYGSYTFTAEMVDSSSSTSYKYFKVCLVDERCLKLAVYKTSLVNIDWVEGSTYTVTGVILGVSDPIDVLADTESDKAPTIRFGIMDANDIQVLETSISFSERDIYYVGEAEPTWLDFLTVIDPEDGGITLTPEMITEDVDMAVAGDYEVTVSYENSLSQSFVATVNITITDQTNTVTEAIDAVVGSEMFVEGIVVGYGISGETKKPILLEDTANGNTIELWGNDTYNAIEVGDKLVVYTEATKLEKGQPRLDKHELVNIVDSGNALYAPEVIADLDAFLVNLETSGDVIFGSYTFTAEMIDSTSNADYKYFKVCGVDERCLKLAVYKYSVVNIDWVEGSTYTVTGVIFGVSDPIDVLADEESTKSPTIRFGIMEANDIQVLETSISFSERDLYYVGETEPTWIDYLTVVDPEDGEITLTPEMITEEVDMAVAGDYVVTVSYSNSLSQSFVATVDITITDQASTVTEAIDAEVGSKMLVEGIVIGYGLDGDTKKPIIIEDPANGNAIEIWGNSDYSAIEVGDKIVVYTGATTLSKDQPRLDSHELVSIVDSGNALYAPEVIVDLDAFLVNLETSGEVIYGSYTFTAEMVDSSSSTSYKYFKVCLVDERCLKLAVYKTSLVNIDWVEGSTYTVTGVILGVSDSIEELADPESTKAPTIRFGIMDESGIQVLETSISFSERDLYYVGETEPTWIDYLTVVDPEDGEITLTPEMITENIDMAIAGNYEVTVSYSNSLSQSFVATVDITITDQANTVTEAIDAEVGSKMLVEGIVIGYGLDGDTKKPIIIEDPANGNAIEIWGNSDYSAIEVGDKIVVYTGATTLSKDQPRLDSHELVSIVDSGNALYAPEVIVDLELFLDNLETSGDVIYGSYTFTAEMVDSSSSTSYKYFSVCTADERCLQLAIYKTSLVNITWVEGTTYTITGVILGVSDSIEVLADSESTKVPTIRFGIMDINDIVEEPLE
ncbi:hypothetical protein RJI07_07905 [Mycoplasmatota bacterium WC30]